MNYYPKSSPSGKKSPQIKKKERRHHPFKIPKIISDRSKNYLWKEKKKMFRDRCLDVVEALAIKGAEGQSHYDPESIKEHCIVLQKLL